MKMAKIKDMLKTASISRAWTSVAGTFSEHTLLLGDQRVSRSQSIGVKPICTVNSLSQGRNTSVLRRRDDEEPWQAFF